MLEYYKKQLAERNTQVEIAKNSALINAKKYFEAAAHCSNLTYKEVVEVLNELNRNNEAIIALENSAQYAQREVEEAEKKAELEKEVENAKEVLKKAGLWDGGESNGR